MNTMIPIFDLTRLHRSIQSELNRALHRVMRRSVFILGPEVTMFEKEFSAYINSPYAIGVASGTDALTLGLLALGIHPGDEVILPANAYPTAFGVAKSGAKIQLCDVDEQTGLVDIKKLKKQITKKTRAIIPVHLYGNPVDIKTLPNIPILEDCAQAHGASISKKMVGSFGDIGIFSFYPSKNLGALGDGGMVVTKRKSLAHKLLQLRMYGETKRYHSLFISGVSRLDELQAAILRVKLRHLNEWNTQRKLIAQMYIEKLNTVGDIRILTSNPNSALHLFVIRTKKRNALQKYLLQRGIGTAIHYPEPIHTQPAFSHLGFKKGDFPVSETLAHEVLSIPMYPHLTQRETEKIIKEIKSFFT